MTNVNVPTIPREVAEAIEYCRNRNGEASLRDLAQIHSLRDDRSPYRIIDDYSRSLNNQYFEAVANGYNVEKTAAELAEEERRERHVAIRQVFVDKYSSTSLADTAYGAGMLFVINTLGIEVEGINA